MEVVFEPTQESAEERYLYERLHALHESYRKEAEPIVQRLVQIQAMRPMAPFRVFGSPEELACLIFR